jgi:opacity protein-like surface antigen
MSFKLKSALIGAVASVCFIQPTLASLHQSGFYVGTSFGVSFLKGKRTDSIRNALRTLTLFTDKNLNDTSLEANFFAGYRYNPSQTNVVLSLEPFLTYGPFEHTVFRDLAPGFNGNQVATFKRGIGYGLSARIGIIVSQNYLPYIMVGAQRDRFSYISIAPDASWAKTRKSINGIDVGVGIETCLKGIKLALEGKYTQYQRTTITVTEAATGDQAIITTKPKSYSISLRFAHIF